MATLKFWGVRGSIPTPGPETVRYGGNTSCAELRHNDKLFILDAGSGLRVLGNDLLKTGSPITAHIFISHMHWDHIQGIPFFTPAFIPNNHFTFYGSEPAGKDLLTVIADQMDPTYFPIEMKDMGSTMEFKPLFEGTYKIDGIKVEALYVNHPGNALGYKFHLNKKTLVYISDNEPFLTADNNDDPDQVLLGEDGNQKLINFIHDADVLIHDAQYTQDEYENKITWGHSPVEYTVDIAIKSGVKKLVLFHHDPLHNDDMIDQMLQLARHHVQNNSSLIEIIAASEGLTIDI
ncbi:MAG: MBL fold metallo-hydrolase [Calditrichaceae bacterium]|nr:MBL fold metallo-hydrolase [Calditrichaceae bacterium]